MENCYKILGVPQTATAAEIKHAYRAKAKLLHPDITGGKTEESEEFRRLVRAYEVLSDMRQRSIFDMSYAMRGTDRASGSRRHGDSYFDYRCWLLDRRDEESRAKLIFFDLMHHREDDAVSLFKKMNMETAGFSLAKWFTREDFMDYGFILAEELVLRGEYYDAVLLLEKIILMEKSYAYFKLFFPEVMKLTRDVLRSLDPEKTGDELVIDAFERALELGFPARDEAFFLRRMAEAYERIGDSHLALVCNEEAQRLEGKR